MRISFSLIGYSWLGVHFLSLINVPFVEYKSWIKKPFWSLYNIKHCLREIVSKCSNWLWRNSNSLPMVWPSVILKNVSEEIWENVINDFFKSGFSAQTVFLSSLVSILEKSNLSELLFCSVLCFSISDSEFTIKTLVS